MWQVQPDYKARRPFPISIENFLQSGFITYAPIVIVTFIMFSGASWQIFWSTTDAARYQCYALTFWFGSSATALLPATQCSFLNIATAQPAFHLLPLEYPPLTLIPFSLALLFPMFYYQWAFALLMSLTCVLIYWLLLRYGPSGAGVIFTIFLLIGAIATAPVRFDLLPAALTLLCVIAADRQHWTAAYVALAFGVLFKIYPLLLLPGLFVIEQQTKGRFRTLSPSVMLSALPRELWLTIREFRRWEWKNCLIFFALVFGVTGFFASLNFQGAVVNQFAYFIQRPVQIEATGSTFLWIGQHFGVPLHVEYTYGSLNIRSPLNALVSFACTLGFLVGYTITLWLLWRKKLDMTQVSIAILLVFITTGKVFSPQYLLWLIPLLAYAGAFDAFWLICWGTISLLTSYVYIFLYSQPSNPLMVPYVPTFFEAVTIRNAFFVLVTIAYLLNWLQIRQRKTSQPVMARVTRHL